jgi:hypothetical protein
LGVGDKEEDVEVAKVSVEGKVEVPVTVGVTGDEQPKTIMSIIRHA